MIINSRKQANLLTTLLLLCALTTLSYTRQSADGVLMRRVPRFESTNEPIDQVLGRLAKDFHVPIGLEEIASPRPGSFENNLISISVVRGTVCDVLNAVVEADPRYRWEETDGVINVLPKDEISFVLETPVSSFEINEATWTDARQAIRELPEVKSRLKEKGLIERSTILVVGSGNNNLPRFSLKLRNTTLRAILNEILKVRGYSFWVFSRYGNNNQYVSIQAVV